MAAFFIGEWELVVAEEAGLDDDAHTHSGMVFFVGEEAFAVAVVVLEEEALVVALEEAVAYLENRVVVELPSAPFNQCDAETEAIVEGGEVHAGLVDAAVVKDVLIVFSVHDRNPHLAVDYKRRINHDVGSERHLVP